MYFTESGHYLLSTVFLRQCVVSIIDCNIHYYIVADNSFTSTRVPIWYYEQQSQLEPIAGSGHYLLATCLPLPCSHNPSVILTTLGHFCAFGCG